MYTCEKPPYLISADKNLLDIDVVHGYITRSYWAEGISKERIRRVIDNSYCFGLYVRNDDKGKAPAETLTREDLTQIGFSRVLSDLSAIAYLMDVFVLEDYRGQGFGKWITECTMNYPEFKPVRRWILATKDAHELYRRFGFTELDHPEHYMHKYDPEMYKRD